MLETDNVKINIMFPLTNMPVGGGNQFLRSLKEEYIKNEVYSELEDANVILFNSHQGIRDVINAKKKYPDKLFVHRIDGPIRLYNSMEDMRDDVTNTTNKYLADATVFQSIYSRDSNYELGLEKCKYSTVIYNGVNRTVFYPKSREIKGKKIKLIASSWSSNKNKGFDVYKYLDKYLDFDKYEMTFVGNSPVSFENIKTIEPLKSSELADELREHDIYISASRNDPCSNSVLEALSCGLPVICRNEGGHPELVKSAGNAGGVFDKAEEILVLLEEIVNNYDLYSQRIIASDIRDVAKDYYDFFHEILMKCDGVRKKMNRKSQNEIYKAIFRWEHEKIAKVLHI